MVTTVMVCEGRVSRCDPTSAVCCVVWFRNNVPKRWGPESYAVLLIGVNRCGFFVAMSTADKEDRVPGVKDAPHCFRPPTCIVTVVLIDKITPQNCCSG